MATTRDDINAVISVCVLLGASRRRQTRPTLSKHPASTSAWGQNQCFNWTSFQEGLRKNKKTSSI